jgi:hypothetical protein
MSEKDKKFGLVELKEAGVSAISSKLGIAHAIQR